MTLCQGPASILHTNIYSYKHSTASIYAVYFSLCEKTNTHRLLMPGTPFHKMRRLSRDRPVRGANSRDAPEYISSVFWCLGARSVYGRRQRRVFCMANEEVCETRFALSVKRTLAKRIGYNTQNSSSLHGRICSVLRAALCWWNNSARTSRCRNLRLCGDEWKFREAKLRCLF